MEVHYVFRSTPQGLTAEFSQNSVVTPGCRQIEDIIVTKRPDLGNDIYEFNTTGQRCTEACTPEECEEHDYGSTENWQVKAGSSELDLIAVDAENLGFEFSCSEPNGKAGIKFTR